jgi:hypothetical protein
MRHLGRCAELQDGEEVGEIVPQHVTRHGDGVQPRPGARARILHGHLGLGEVDV